MNPRRPSTLRRLWLLAAQTVAIAAGVIAAWRAFGPVPAVSPGVVAVQEAPRAAAPAPVGAASAPARLEASFRTAASRASASVVNVYTRKAPPRRLPNWLRPDGGDDDSAQGASSLGSGVIVATQGYILTNNHVVEGADEIAVMLPGEKVAEARVIGTDPESDLAVLRVEAKGLQPITFADPASVKVGDIVLAVGDPSARPSPRASSAPSGAIGSASTSSRTSSRPTRPSTPATPAARWSTSKVISSASTPPSTRAAAARKASASRSP